METMVGPDKFLPGFSARLHFKQPFRHALQPHAQLLPHFPQRTGIVLFPLIQMPRSRGIPDSRKTILLQRTLLQEQLAARIENQDMHRPMFQPALMHLAAWRLANDFVQIIDDIKNLFTHVPDELVASFFVSRTNCSRETASARMVTGRLSSAKACSNAGTG